MVMLPDIEARKQRLSRLNKLNLLRQSPQREELKVESILTTKSQNILKKYVDNNSKTELEGVLKKFNLTDEMQEESSLTMESEKEIKLKTNTGRSTSSEDIKIITNELPINVKREKIVIDIQDQEELQISTEESLNPEQLLSRKEVRFNDLLPRNWTFLKDNKTHY